VATSAAGCSTRSISSQGSTCRRTAWHPPICKRCSITWRVSNEKGEHLNHAAQMDLTSGRLAPEIEAAHVRELTATWSRARGLLGWLSTTDHKHIALRYIVTAFTFFLM